MEQVLLIDHPSVPDNYTRIVKPYDDGSTRRERINWCQNNCEKKFKTHVGSRIVLSAELEHEYDRRPGEPPNKKTRELLHVLFFESGQDAMMFVLAN